MTTLHTPGPWGISTQSTTTVKQYDALGETNVIVASALSSPNSGFFPDDEVGIANARLIAAAPDLLEALKRCRFDSLNMTMDDLKFCSAAIAKATGA
jgi:hypothetical protein